MTTKTFTGYVDVNGFLCYQTAAGSAFVDVTKHIGGVYGGKFVRATIEQVGQVVPHECDKCKAGFMVDSAKAPPTCCGNLVPMVVISDPSNPPAGGNWYWKAHVGCWVKVEPDDLVLHSDQVALITRALNPHVTSGDAGAPVGELIARVIAKLVAERVSVGPTKGRGLVDVTSLKGGEQVQWTAIDGGVYHGTFMGPVAGAHPVPLFYLKKPGGVEVHFTAEDARERGLSLVAEPEAKPEAPQGAPSTAPERCAKHDVAIRCRVCQLEEAHRRAFDGVYVGEGR